ncbi:MAG: sigma-54-dependent Fis family transcriptional regulator [Parvularculaceae bacterium]|nr:sigma-54-dependent Fis family transcriptional regulator [Parvularculaceae bacterium]
MDPDGDGLGRSGGEGYLRYEKDGAVIRDIEWRGPDLRRSGKPERLAFGRAAPIPDARDISDVIIGSSPRAAALREQIRLYAEYDSPVLLTGETGAGKELIARELHRLSARRGRPFIALNAGAVPETLAGAELFGHTKGAFTGAVAEREGAFVAADGGSLFLDEIGDAPMSVQTQLLRVLDDGVAAKIGSRQGVKTDFRLISATNIDLARNVEAGTFRRDLFYRINVLSIDAPPLRERGDDAVEIAEHFIRTHEDERLRNAYLTPKAADRLKAYLYPGNIRELRNIVQRALVHARGGKILAEHVGIAPAERKSASKTVDVSTAKELVGRFAVLKALKQTGGNVVKAAELAGRSRSSVHAMTKEFGAGGVTAEYERLRGELRSMLED